MPMMLPSNSAPYHVALRPTEFVGDVEREASREDVGVESCVESCSGGLASILYDLLVNNCALTR